MPVDDAGPPDEPAPRAAQAVVPRVIVLGRPGSGKGTQGHRLARALGVPHLSMGDLLRTETERGSRVGCEIAAHVAAGRLAPDAVVAAVLAEHLSHAAAAGFVLDGYPRTIAQAVTLEQLLGSPADLLAVELVVPEHEAAHRLQSRFVCTRCGHPEPVRLARARERRSTVCGRCGDALRRRGDDDEAVVRRRFREFEECTKPLLDWLDERGMLVTVDADRPPGEVTSAVLAAVGSRLALPEHAACPPQPREVPA